MRKILRMFLVMVLATIGFNAYAGTIVFADLGLENGVQYPDPFDGGDFTVQFVGGGNDGKYYNTGTAIRMYGDGKMKLGAKSGSITKVIVTWDSSNKPTTSDVVNVGTYDVESGIWTGKSDSVFFTRPTGTGNWRVQKLEVTIEGGSTITVPTPSISGTTPFTENTEVTISGTPEGGKTYYTTDGSNPTSSSTLYSAPFTLTETTTVKAISYDKDGNASSVASKIFEKEEIATANTIAELLAMESGKTANLKLNNAVVLFAGKNDIIIKDATGGIDFYQTGLSLTAGQILNGSIIIERSDYNNFKEVKKTNNTNLDNVTITDGTVTPTVSTVANVAASEDCADLYKLEKVEVVANGSNYDIVDGETTLRLYDQFKLNFTKAAGKFNLVGVIGNFKGTKQFWPTETPESTEEVTIGEASDISEFIGIEEKGKPYKLTLENAQVVYSWTSTNGNIQAFVRDETGALCFDFRNDFKTAGTAFVTNKMVNGTIIMNNNVYNGLPQASAIAETNTEKLTFTDGSEAQPVKISAADVSKNINDLVLLENVTIEEKESKYYVGDVQLYNQFHIEGYDDLSSFVGEGKNVKGIAVIYQPKTGDPVYEIYPIEITSQGGGETPQGTDKTWNFSEWEAGDITETKTVDGLTVMAISGKVVTIDANDKTVDDVKYTQRLKLGGTGAADNRILKFDVTGACSIKVILCSASSSDDRTLNICKNEWNKDNPLSTMAAPAGSPVATTYNYTGEAATIILGSANSGVNIYAIYVTYGSSGIQNVVKPVVENGIRYNLAGQRVDENYKGVVIMNGKKYVVK